VSNDDDGDASGVRIGGGATRQAILPVTDTGLGDDFIDFDDDPDLPEDAIHEAPLVNIPAEDEDEDAGADADGDLHDAWAAGDEDPNADPRWCPAGTADRLARVPRANRVGIRRAIRGCGAGARGGGVHLARRAVRGARVVRHRHVPAELRHRRRHLR
jgi:hypothetical protein